MADELPPEPGEFLESSRSLWSPLRVFAVLGQVLEDFHDVIDAIKRNELHSMYSHYFVSRGEWFVANRRRTVRAKFFKHRRHLDI